MHDEFLPSELRFLLFYDADTSLMSMWGGRRNPPDHRSYPDRRLVRKLVSMYGGVPTRSPHWPEVSGNLEVLLVVAEEVARYQENLERKGGGICQSP
jgi:hypothetical protein